MNFFLNYILAWVTVFLLIFLSLKYVIRKLASGNGKHKEFFKKLNKSSRKSHIFLGVLVCITGLLHGIFSGQDILSFNIGTLLWVVTLLLGLSYAVRKLFKNKKIWLVIHRALTVLTLALIVVHVLDVGGITIFDELNYMASNKNNTQIVNAQVAKTETPTTEATTTVQSETVTTEPTPSPTTESTIVAEVPKNTIEAYNSNLFGVVLKDGTYTGVANGYGPNLTVQVVVLNNNVTNISVVSHNEKNSRFYATPIKEIPVSIVDTQSLDVDTISGATFTSVGIINAVNEALSQAVVSGQLPQTLSLPTKKGH